MGWGAGLSKSGGPTENQNINKRGGGGGGKGGGGRYGEVWGLLPLNPGAQGEYFTSQLSWPAA